MLERLQDCGYLQVSHGAYAKMIIQYLYPQNLAQNKMASQYETVF